MVKIKKENGVSPVIGVMLMLVVVIIIAAVISVYAAGFLADSKAAPNLQIGYVGVLSGPVMNGGVGGLGETGLVFEHKGGDQILLSDIELQLKTTLAGGDEVTIMYTDSPSATYIGQAVEKETRLSLVYSYRMKKIGVSDAVNTATTIANTMIKSGDRFVIHADRYITDTESKFGRVYYVADRGLSETPYSSGEFEVSSKTVYTLTDKNSGAVISSGTLVGSVL